ncbi:hypothetical protein GCM10010358_20340 [Streptomyces minutiscleroticus]|uniref:Uncharacterized protein n=1 Tax=Streptomyces minutiscleroticus TaxID=68238 RepID=A0A918KJ63_9ACTN|nr:hypothetical protein GCM10010358_20340 [Streptomyces minutiscleroticus]
MPTLRLRGDGLPAPARPAGEAPEALRPGTYGRQNYAPRRPSSATEREFVPGCRQIPRAADRADSHRVVRRRAEPYRVEAGRGTSCRIVRRRAGAPEVPPGGPTGPEPPDASAPLPPGTARAAAPLPPPGADAAAAAPVRRQAPEPPEPPEPPPRSPIQSVTVVNQSVSWSQ